MPFDVRDFPGAPPEDRAAGRGSRRLVAIWLFSVAFMILVMIVIGGVTRLSGSGLSIAEWAPFAGTLPPLGEAEWQRLYHLYQQIPQYTLVNEDLSLGGFKGIFWLEWIHRLWGRLIGLAFIGPLIWLWAAGRIERRLRPRLALLFVLGGFQGAVGWFMVASGFAPGATSVSPYRLVIHLALALTLYAAIVWTGLTVLRPVPPRPAAGRLLYWLAWACCASVALTMLAGGFVAGTHAGLDYNTFPLMDGRLVPLDYARLAPFARNLTENIAAVQFDHRAAGDAHRGRGRSRVRPRLRPAGTTFMALCPAGVRRRRTGAIPAGRGDTPARGADGARGAAPGDRHPAAHQLRSCSCIRLARRPVPGNHGPGQWRRPCRRPTFVTIHRC